MSIDQGIQIDFETAELIPALALVRELERRYEGREHVLSVNCIGGYGKEISIIVPTTDFHPHRELILRYEVTAVGTSEDKPVTRFLIEINRRFPTGRHQEWDPTKFEAVVRDAQAALGPKK